MNNLYVRLAKNNLKNNKSLYVPYMVAGMITVLMFYIMMFINNSVGLEKMRGAYYITTIMSFGVIVVGGSVFYGGNFALIVHSGYAFFICFPPGNTFGCGRNG